MTLARLRLARTEGVGPVTFRRLMDRFMSAEAALDALPGLAEGAGRTTPPRIPAIEAIQREMEALDRLGAHLLIVGDPAYPPLLAQLEAPPPVLAVLGDPACLSAECIALVGARNASANGQRVAELLAADLALAGLVVVSGLARGIDAAAHRGAMQCGRTVAAVAGGLDVPYPPENAKLHAAIAENGAVVAEAPLGTAPQARHFPRRNRVIAGLSRGTVVIEAAPQSGSLITARMAQEAGRELFAVPGSPLDPRSRGSNALIRSEGAHLTETAADVTRVLADLRQFATPPLAAAGFAELVSPAEDPVAIRLKLMELLGPSPTPVDDLLRRCHFSASAVLGVIGELEAEGAVQQVGGQVFQVAE